MPPRETQTHNGDEMPHTSNRDDVERYFEYSSHGIEVLADGLQELPFGEYLVEQNAIDRYQLLRALQRQDEKPNVPIGECVAALGFLRWAEVRRHLSAWRAIDEVVL